MYFKFLQHGKGDPAKAAAYVVDKVDHLNRPRADVQVLRGDPQTFAVIANSIQNEWLYTSGVIAWSKTDDPSDEEISAVLDAFEKHAFAGLQPNQYHFTAVLHQEDDGSKHVHFLVPRIELDTGNALNIAPPGHEYYFDPLRDYFNYKHGWARPDDPALQNDIQLPDHVHLINAAALHAGLKGKKAPEICELIGLYLEQRIEHGFVRNRNDVLETLSEIGQINRINDKFISVLLPGREKPLRLPGAFYESDFTLESYLENRTREEADARASRENRVISEEHKQLAADNLELVRERAAGRAEYNAERYFKLERANEEPELYRVRQPEHDAVYESTVAAQPSSTATDRTVDSEYTSAVQSAEPAAQAAQIHADNRDFIANDFNFSRTDQVNERLKNIDESTTRTIREASRATDSSIAAVGELQQAVGRTKRAFDAREPSEIRLDYNSEETNSQHRIGKAIQRVFAKIRTQYESTFANSIIKSARSIAIAAEHQPMDSRQNQSITAAVTSRSYAIDETAFGNFYTDYRNFKRSEFKRGQRQVAEVRKLSQRIDETATAIDLMARKVSSLTIKPRPASDLTDYFRKIAYSSRAAKLLYSWSEKQHEAFENRNLSQVAYYIQAKYQELSDYARYKQGLDCEEIALVQKIIRNDERIVDYMKKKGCYLAWDDQQRLDRILSVEKSANEHRLNNFVLNENKVDQLFQEKSEMKNLNNEKSHESDLPRSL
ncbi:hypothetical protein [Acinetobacter variabilis]|uniref:hypothetical protein n=1 Tax=Acinetobacter variabilis TaxID=70346 RepID=UPI002FDACED5